MICDSWKRRSLRGIPEDDASYLFENLIDQVERSFKERGAKILKEGARQVDELIGELEETEKNILLRLRSRVFHAQCQTGNGDGDARQEMGEQSTDDARRRRSQRADGPGSPAARALISDVVGQNAELASTKPPRAPAPQLRCNKG